MKRQYFGTDGVRGLYGSPTMNEDFAWRLGVAAARRLTQKGVAHGKILIGRDTRTSGVSLAQALADGFAHGGFEPWSLEVIPTPAVARAVRVRGAALGAVITASHNPATDNGIKFFSGDGTKLTDEEEAAIEALLPERRIDPGSVELHPLDGTSDYIYSMTGVLHGSLAGWKIALDTANGATVLTSSFALRELGAEVIAIGADPDGLNINQEVGSEHPEELCSTVRLHNARLGIAHDGDGDRCLFCDERGDVLDGDEVLTILALHAGRDRAEQSRGRRGHRGRGRPRGAHPRGRPLCDRRHEGRGRATGRGVIRPHHLRRRLAHGRRPRCGAEDARRDARDRPAAVGAPAQPDQVSPTLRGAQGPHKKTV
jgi:phosphoglucosamine mutase